MKKSTLDSFGFNTFRGKDAREKFSQMWIFYWMCVVQFKQYRFSMDLYQFVHRVVVIFLLLVFEEIIFLKRRKIPKCIVTAQWLDLPIWWPMMKGGKHVFANFNLGFFFVCLIVFNIINLLCFQEWRSRPTSSFKFKMYMGKKFKSV